MRYVVGDEAAIGRLSEEVQEARNGTVLEVRTDRVAVAIDQRDSGEVQVALSYNDLHLLPLVGEETGGGRFTL